jgi:ABC-type transport system involved in cytochrome c biogenesis permease subunit
VLAAIFCDTFIALPGRAWGRSARVPGLGSGHLLSEPHVTDSPMIDGRKKRFARVAFGLNGALFLLASFDAFEAGKSTLGGVQLVAGIVNLLLLLFSHGRRGVARWLNYLTFIMNCLVALAVASDYRSSGTVYLHYVWYLVAIVSIVALFTTMRKEKKASGAG